MASLFDGSDVTGQLTGMYYQSNLPLNDTATRFSAKEYHSDVADDVMQR